MTRCAKCGDEVIATPTLRRLQGVISWCARCWTRPSDHGLDRYSVSSNTDWHGGRVRKAPSLDDAED